MKVAVVRYNAGNIRSVVNALHRIGVEPVVTDDPAELAAADRVIFPGQGEAATTMGYLRKSGLDAVIRNLKQPVLGICIGQQLLCAHSEEGDTPCLGVFESPVVRFPATCEDGRVKIPQMGWNTIENLHTPLFDGLKEGDFVYFVHSFYVPDCAEAIARTTYGGVTYASALRSGNFYTTQFHPEKSGDAGLRILHNFIHLCHD